MYEELPHINRHQAGAQQIQENEHTRNNPPAGGTETEWYGRMLQSPSEYAGHPMADYRYLYRSPCRGGTAVPQPQEDGNVSKDKQTAVQRRYGRHNLLRGEEPHKRHPAATDGLQLHRQGGKPAKHAVSGLKKLAEEGPTEEQLTRTVENFKKDLPEDRISNGYWLGNLRQYHLYGYDYDKEYEAVISEINAENIKAALQSMLSEGNFIEIIMNPQE